VHYLAWPGASPKPVVLVHGVADWAWTWRAVAEALGTAYSPYALDLPGHGDSIQDGTGLQSHQAYVVDLASLVAHVGVTPVVLIAHSMGGTVAMQYAAAFPETVEKLVVIDELGPIELPTMPAPRRLRLWVTRLQELERRPVRRYHSVEEVAQRMRRANDRLTGEQALERARAGTAVAPDGSVLVKVDRYAYTTQPDYRLFQFTRAELEELWRNVSCPVLYVTGTESEWRNTEYEQRAAGIVPDLRMQVIDGAGHHVHHERLEEFLSVLWPFLR
jgi:pimeloyl-ACP methyl ester carboxylesterase